MARLDGQPMLPTAPPTTATGTADMDHLDGNFCYLEKFRLYETRARFYLIGTDQGKRFLRVLKIDRSERSELNISEDPVVYSQLEVSNLLKRISEGNRSTGGLTFIGKACGIVGCIKFLESYYLIVVRKRRQIGSICGHAIYSIEESQMITVPHSSVQSDISHSKNELRYKKLLSSVDLTKDFFYSYTYPIMKSLQKNVTENINGCMPYENMFVWNAFLTNTIRSRCNNTLWTIPLVHGNFKQVRLSIYGREFTLTLISRRSRHFAGTRYLKRGVNDCGWVANDVETEQMVLDEEAGSSKGRMSSVVQMRGSIPLFWSQDSRLSPKPDIILQRYDPTYEATVLHFEDLVKRYNNPIIVLNLIKTVEKRPREMMLRREFAHAVGYLNRILPKEKQLKFIHWDFNKFAKSKANVLAVLGGVANEALDLTGFYYSGKPMLNKRSGTKFRRTATRELSLSNHIAVSEDLARINSNATKSLNPTVTREKEKEVNQHLDRDSGSRFQSGVLRTNCIDCLDRTNVAQYVYGLAALGRQLHAMGLTDTVKVDHDSSIAATLMDMYQNMGDALAQQYGGSAAHNTIFPEKQGKWKATTQSREFLKSIKRYYSNAYTDGEKQDAINLFLGYFEPQEGKPALWDLDSDYYLHVNGAGSEIPPVNGKNSLKTSRVVCSTLPVSQNAEFQVNLAPVPACKKDFARMKLTSFDKLLETTGSYIKNVRLCSELDVKANAIISSPVVAPDAAEIQLKSPNWLFGQRKQGESVAAPKVSLVDNGAQCRGSFTIDEYWDSSSPVPNKENLFKSYLNPTANGNQSWYVDTSIYVQDEKSEEYRHYAEICQEIAMDPFRHDPDKEKYYDTALRLGLDNADDTLVEAEMEAALREYSQIGSDLGISPRV